MKNTFDRSKGSSKYLSVKELFCSGSRTSSRAEAGSPLKSLPTLSISSNKNTGSFLPRPLLDRMEVIQLEGYTPNEKFNIAKKYLISKQIEENGLNKENISISDRAIKDIIDYYTRVGVLLFFYCNFF